MAIRRCGDGIGDSNQRRAQHEYRRRTPTQPRGARRAREDQCGGYGKELDAGKEGERHARSRCAERHAAILGAGAAAARLIEPHQPAQSWMTPPGSWRSAASAFSASVSVPTVARRRPLGLACTASEQFRLGTRKTVAPWFRALIIFCWMPPMGPTLPLPSISPVPATTTPPVRSPGVSRSMIASAYISPALGPPTSPASMLMGNGGLLMSMCLGAMPISGRAAVPANRTFAVLRWLLCT